MVNIHRHNPALQARLRAAVEAGDGAALVALLRQLSNSEFRTAGYLLGEDVLPTMVHTEHFLTLLVAVVPTNAKAYLGTFLKAAVPLCRAGKVALTDARLKVFAEVATPIDRRKVLETLLPLATAEAEVNFLLEAFCSDDIDAVAALLLRCGTTVCYYHLFRRLRPIDDDTERLKKYYLLLLKKNEPRAYNMACILRDYFDLGDVPGHLSLQLPPYKFSRLELTLEAFEKILKQ